MGMTYSGVGGCFGVNNGVGNGGAGDDNGGAGDDNVVLE